jgi:hypothetical protein
MEYYFSEVSQTKFKTSLKNNHPRIAQNDFSGFSPIFYIYPVISIPQHNGHNYMSPTHALQSIKVTPRKWRKRTLKNE